MKTIKTLILAAMTMCMLAVSCKKNGNAGPANKLVDTWQIEYPGDLEGEIITSVLEIRDDGTMTMTCRSNYAVLDDGSGNPEDMVYIEEMYWKTDGDRFLYAYKDEDGDGVEEPIEDLVWNEYQYELDDDEFSLEMSEGEVDRWDYYRL